MCGVQFKDRKISTDLMLVLCLSETIYHLTIASSVCWYRHVLSRGNGHVLRRALDLEVESHTKKGRLKRTWK